MLIIYIIYIVNERFGSGNVLNIVGFIRVWLKR